MSVTHTLAPGDVLILSSDGVIEAHNDQNELFGLDRLERSVLDVDTAQSASTIHRDLLHMVQAFVDDAQPHDDVTLIVLKVKQGANQL